MLQDVLVEGADGALPTSQPKLKDRRLTESLAGMGQIAPAVRRFTDERCSPKGVGWLESHQPLLSTSSL